MKKGWLSLCAVAFLVPFVITGTAGAAGLDKQAPSKSKTPVKVEQKGNLTIEYYDGPSPVKLPSEKEIAKKHGKKASKSQSVSAMLSGYQYDNTDPEVTGCANDAFTPKSVVVKNGAGTALAVTELRYSPACRTAWGRMMVYDYQSTNYGIAQLFRRESHNGGPYQYYFKDYTFISPGDTNYTNQFYDGGTTSYVGGTVVDRYGNSYYYTTAPY